MLIMIALTTWITPAMAFNPVTLADDCVQNCEDNADVPGAVPLESVNCPWHGGVHHYCSCHAHHSHWWGSHCHDWHDHH